MQHYFVFRLFVFYSTGVLNSNLEQLWDKNDPIEVLPQTNLFSILHPGVTINRN